MKKENLYILWTNADEITSEKMVMMYALNAKVNNWWKDITIILWGSPNQLVENSSLIRDHIKKALEMNIKVSACKSCADQLGTTDLLLDLGVEVKYWGEDLTSLLKEEATLLTI